MREIVLDTETTGIDPEDGHRLVEIGCVELLNHVPTGKSLQIYINPERDMPPEATAIHGLTGAFLANKPVFAEVFSDFIAFLGDARLVIHNAEFDMKFINAELRRVGHGPLPWSRVTDTLPIARQKFPGSPVNLDALCRRFNIDNSGRVFHGALLDAELLAEVYLELMGGRQHGLGLTETFDQPETALVVSETIIRIFRQPRVHAASEEEMDAHLQMLEKIKAPLWRA